MRLFTLLCVVFWGLACVHSATAAPDSGSPSSCAGYLMPSKNAACKVTGNFDLASVNQDLKVIYGSSGTLSVVQPDAIIAPSLDTSVVDLKSIDVAQNARSRLKNVRPKLRPHDSTFYASRILNVLDKKGRSDLSECLHLIEPRKQVELFPSKMDDIKALSNLIEQPSAWNQVASNLFGREPDEGFCVDYLSLILVES